MAAINYEPFVERMIGRYEGGYGWNRADPGGPTKYGITCYDLAEYLHEPMDSMSAWAPRVKAMTLAVAAEIYQTKYAARCSFAALNSGPDCAVFDFGVNSGPSRAIKFSQRIVGTAQDGILGAATLEAINGYDPAQFINKLCDDRLAFLRSLKTWSTFGRGWSARVRDLRAYALRLVHPPEVEVLEPERKETRIPLAFARARDDVATA